MKELHEILVLAKKKYRYTVREMEFKSGISNPYLCRLMKGNIKSPSIETIKKLSSLFPAYEEDFLLSVGIKGYFTVN